MKRSIAMVALVMASVVVPAMAADAPVTIRKPAVAQKSMDLRKGSFHKVHTKKLKLGCDGCHATELSDVLFLRASEVVGRPPGPVDRAICAGCHQAPGKPVWYGPAP